MRITAGRSVQNASHATTEVRPQRTPVTREQMRTAIGRALEKTDGKRPTSQLVDVLTAQASLETAGGDRMHNFNFGGIKGHSPNGATAVCRTHEVIQGRDVVIRDGFRAYGSLDEGALDYVRTMKNRFGDAMAPASRGDVAGFAASLKRAGYYTASETDYARGLAAQLHAPQDVTKTPFPTTAAMQNVASSSSTSDFTLTAAGLSRVEGSLDAGHWLDALAPSVSSRRPSTSSDEEES